MCRCALVLPAAAAGLFGVLQDSRKVAHSFAGSDTHLLFGALLWLSVIAQFWSLSRKSAEPVEAHVRNISRRVFVLLYGLAGVRELCVLLPQGVGGVAAGTMVQAMSTLQCYVAFGIVALVTIRVLGACELRTRDSGIPRGDTPRV